MRGITSRTDLNSDNWAAHFANRLKYQWTSTHLRGSPPFAPLKRHEAHEYSALHATDRYSHHGLLFGKTLPQLPITCCLVASCDSSYGRLCWSQKCWPLPLTLSSGASSCLSFVFFVSVFFSFVFFCLLLLLSSFVFSS